MPLDANSVLKEIVKFWRWINHDTSVNLVGTRLWFLHWNGLPIKGKGPCITAKWGIRYFKFHDDPDNTFAVIPSDSLQWNISAIYSYCEWPKPLTLSQKCCARNVENEGLPGLSQNKLRANSSINKNLALFQPLIFFTWQRRKYMSYYLGYFRNYIQIVPHNTKKYAATSLVLANWMWAHKVQQMTEIHLCNWAYPLQLLPPPWEEPECQP